MPRRQIEFRAGEHYHVYNRGVNRAPVFFERENYLFFLKRLREIVVPIAADCLAYCLMPNHYHLVLRLVKDELPESMQAFGTSYTKAINKRIQRVGPLFQGRFQAVHIDQTEYLLYLSRYVHLNPVESELVPRPEDWEFSSYREYVGLRDGTLPLTEPILAELGTVEEYRKFVNAGIGKRDQLIDGMAIDSRLHE